jgi:hypothetical protein
MTRSTGLAAAKIDQRHERPVNSTASCYASIMRAIVLAIIAVVAVGAADRHWQTGKWISVESKRKMVDFGPGASPFGGGGRPASPSASMRAEADVRTYVIETDDLRLELEDTVKVNTRSLDAVVGLPVTFALEKGSVYVRDSDNVEHKLRVTKKINKQKS